MEISGSNNLIESDLASHQTKKLHLLVLSCSITNNQKDVSKNGKSRMFLMGKGSKTWGENLQFYDK